MPDPGTADTGVCVVLSTAPSLAVAERLVRTLVDEGLVACGNIVPGAVSIYRWRGEVRRDDESMLVLKTTVHAVPRLLERLPALHPYEVPEILVLRVAEGSRSYLTWIAEETAVTGEPAA